MLLDFSNCELSWLIFALSGLVRSSSWEGLKLVAVAVGENHSLALSSDGQVFSWGSNQYGQLGVPSENSIEPK